MHNLVEEFASLLARMEQALVANDVAMVNTLTEQQQTCLSEIVQSAAKDSTVKDDIRQAMPEMKRQLQVNDALLQQAIDVNNTLMSIMYGKLTGRPQAQASVPATAYRV